MNLKRGIVSVASSLILTLSACYSAPQPPMESVGEVYAESAALERFIHGEKYAVICTGASLRNEEEGLIDPIDKNTFWVSTVKIYNDLLEDGYEPENIFVLYKDGKPPFDDLELLNQIGEIQKEFDGSYKNIATEENLTDILNSLESRIMPQDSFTLYINQHGDKYGGAHFEHDYSVIYGHDLTDVLEGNRSKNILIVIGTCFAEAFTDRVNYDAIIISGVKEGQLGWSDRNFSFGRFFFEEMNNLENDTDGDGDVSPHEAFIPAREGSIQYREEMDDFLRNEYEGTGLPERDLEIMDLVPVYKDRR